MVEPVGDLCVLLAGGVDLGHAVRQLLLLRFQFAQGRKNSHALGKDGAPRERKALLRQVAHADALLYADAAGIQAFDAGQNLEQGGLAGAVCAHDPGAFLRRHQPVDIFKKDFGAVALSRPAELDHWLRTIVAGRQESSPGARRPTGRPRGQATGRRKCFGTCHIV